MRMALCGISAHHWKVGGMKKQPDRKARVELVFHRAYQLSGKNAEDAWHRLTAELDNMSSPEARPPRFKSLLRAIWAAATNEQS